MEANQAELDRLGLGAISIPMPGTRPAPKPAATKRKALQPVRRGVPQRRAAAGAMEDIAKLLDEASRTDKNGELLRERRAPVVIPTAADLPAAAGRGRGGGGAGRSTSAAPKKRARVQPPKDCTRVHVAGVDTHRYSPLLDPGDHFWQSYEKNQVQKIRHRIHHTILKTAKSTFVPRVGACAGPDGHPYIWMAALGYACTISFWLR
jgi:hypothetical protein